MSNLQVDLERWYSLGDELAYRRAFRRLQGVLLAPRDVIDVLGNAAVDEVRQDVLMKLLGRDAAHLSGVEAPIAFAKTAMRRQLTSVVRKWALRGKRTGEVRQHLEATAVESLPFRVEARLDADTALSIAAKLSGKGRLAILLTTSPERIEDGSWRELVASLPPPPPKRPTAPLERDEASRLLYPPRGPETAKQRNQRLNSFDKAFKRAVDKIRTALGGAE